MAQRSSHRRISGTPAYVIRRTHRTHRWLARRSGACGGHALCRGSVCYAQLGQYHHLSCRPCLLGRLGKRGNIATAIMTRLSTVQSPVRCSHIAIWRLTLNSDSTIKSCLGSPNESSIEHVAESKMAVPSKLPECGAFPVRSRPYVNCDPLMLPHPTSRDRGRGLRSSAPRRCRGRSAG
jgi:hypothetical protein